MQSAMPPFLNLRVSKRERRERAFEGEPKGRGKERT